MKISGTIMNDKVAVEIEFTIHLNKPLDEKIDIYLDNTHACVLVDIVESYGCYDV